MTFIGYEQGSKAYRFWNPKTHKVVISADVTFVETEFPSKPFIQPVKPVDPDALAQLIY